MTIKNYFKPTQTPGRDNYYTVRYLRSGKAVSHQMPQEGIYTEAEMSRIDASRVPGEWIKLDHRDTAIIFGLRQHCPRQVAALQPFTFDDWHAWQGEQGMILLSDESASKLRSFDNVDGAVNWLFLAGEKPAARALNAHYKKGQ